MRRVTSLFVLGLVVFSAWAHAQQAPAPSPAAARPASNDVKPTEPGKPESSQNLATSNNFVNTLEAPAPRNVGVASNRTGSVCTLIAGSFELKAVGIRLTQYSTLGFASECDEIAFNNLTQATIEAQLRAVQRPSFVIRGGVHRLLMDVNLATLPQPFIKIGPLDFTAVGTIDIGLIEFLRNPNFKTHSLVSASEYSAFTLRSNIQYIWNMGKPVHTLVTPTGDRYVMYAFTTRVVPQLKVNNLAYLGPLLRLPEGWTYESYLLDKTLTIKTTASKNFEVSIMFDDANNLYIKMPD
jgi:hypothetical protein